MLVLRYNLLTELLLESATDDEDDLAETSTDSIEDRVVHDGLSCGTYAIELLESAVAATHASSEDDKSWLFHCFAYCDVIIVSMRVDA